MSEDSVGTPAVVLTCRLEIAVTFPQTPVSQSAVSALGSAAAGSWSPPTRISCMRRILSNVLLKDYKIGGGGGDEWFVRASERRD